ncbi:hypothetical protein Tco_0332000, partial [Tanacetum coccineum]
MVIGVEDCLLKREWGGRGVKEKNKDVAAKDGVSPSVTVGTVVMEKKISLVDTSIPTVENMELCSYPPLPTHGSTMAGNTPVMSLYANVTGNTPAFSDDGLSAIATKISTPLILDSYTLDMYLQSWGRLVPKKATANSSGNKNKGLEPTNEVSNSNLFDVLTTVDNDMELGTNGGTLNSSNKWANSGGSSFWNVKNSSTNTTPIIDKTGKYESLIIDGQSIIMDKDGNPLKRKGLALDLLEVLQTICDNLDIRVRGRRKAYLLEDKKIPSVGVFDE